MDTDDTFEHRLASRLLDVLIRAGLIVVLALLCYQVFSPFLSLMVWAVILAVTLYPLQRALARRMGGRMGWAATLVTLLGIALIVAPTAVLLNSTGDSVKRLIDGVQQNTLQVPPPRESVAAWPVVGGKIHEVWEKAHADLPALVQSLQPKIGELARAALAMVAAIGGGILKFIAALIVAGIMMAFGESGARGCRAIFVRVFGEARGDEFTRLSVATVRAVAQGVIGIAFIQALAVGLCLLAAKVPLAGILSGVVLVLGIAQIPALIVTLPAIAYLWMSGNYDTVPAVVFSVLLFIAGMADNVLKPLMLGRGVDAPMPVILIGALGGLATAGILGLFVGATLLALGYQIFMGWVSAHPQNKPAGSEAEMSKVESTLTE
ncbi:AI-2E family transporter [Ramlibacter solisilvae]|uniref:Permease n=1 Tax=Ramlibacter tataouinensis TaxID=94132 RepID=A0A127JYB4_9BURK|nr:AI-2E family transporter [Ramlibacter tataouinensis]AMO24976.1 permease [Ramlibacter tataouinensis]